MEDYNSIAKYFKSNISKIDGFFSVVWDSLIKMFGKSIDYKIDSIEKGMDEKYIKTYFNVNLNSQQKLLESFQELKTEYLKLVPVEKRLK